MRFLLLCAVLLAAATAFAGSLPRAPHVYVEGSSEIRVVPDTVTIAAAIVAIDPDLAKAKATADEKARVFIEACRGIGVADADISSANLAIGPAYEYVKDERKLVGTRVQRDIEVVLRQIDQYPALLRALVTAGVAEITSTRLSSSKGKDTISQAQVAALADARSRAERLAEAAGRKLGAVYSISEFDQREDQYLLFPTRGIGRSRHQSVEFDGVAGIAKGGEPFEPGTIVAGATVYVVYLLEEE